MRKLMVAAGAAAFLAAVSFANAAEVTGAITAIDATAGSVTLDNGQTYKLSTSITASAWKVGDKVKLTFDDASADKMVTAVTPAS
jgi:ubiquinone/menaquinone biosynthesis C-methylase UbiE